MDNMILGDGLQIRQGSGGLPAIGADGLPTTPAVVIAPGTTTLPTATPVGTTITTTATPTETSATAAASTSSPGSNNGISSTTLIAILVPVCVVLAAVPTAAYLIYLRRRDRRAREAEMLRGRGAGSSSGATGEALLTRRSTSAASHHERKIASLSSEELELAAGGAALEKSMSSTSHRQKSDIFSPASHGPSTRRPPPSAVSTQMKPGFKPPPVASQSPTLPPLDFGKDDNTSFSPLTQPSGTTSNGASPPKPTVPATLPTFAPTQPKQRAPNAALAPGRQAAPSPSPADNPSWPLPAPAVDVRDSASTYSSIGGDRVPSTVYQNKPLPSSLNKEIPQASTSAVAARQLQQQQHGPRESSIAYGVPPVPPSPEAEGPFVGDRRSGASRKRDSDAVSELSYSASTRGRRDTRRDTDAISVISALSQNDR